VQKILFDSTQLPGDERLRKEQWVDSLSSGYARLHADAAPETPFAGALKIMLLGHTSIGSILGTVRTISRNAEDIAAENTDNVVLLFNSGQDGIRIEQKGKGIDCAAGGAVLIEQSEPSIIKMAAQKTCGLVAIQAPRKYVLGENPHVENHFVTTASIPALSLVRAYVDILLQQPSTNDAAIPRLAGHHISDLIAAAVSPDSTSYEMHSPSMRAARLETIRRDLDRHFLEQGLSLSTLARRVGVTPRYVQALFAEGATSFTDELNKRRLVRAHDMLASARYAHMNVTEVAHECGFSTVAHFHRMFRRRFETTPGAVRSKSGA
jgi:AraC-like DNA-binding protein